MCMFIYKSSDYTLQSNDSNITIILKSNFTHSFGIDVCKYRQVHGAVSSENLVLTKFMVGWEEGLQKHQSACKILGKYSP